MGKIILTEKQYSRLKQNLVEQTISYVDKRENKSLLKEDDINAESVGKKVQAIFVRCKGSYSDGIVQQCINDVTEQLKRLTSKDEAIKAAKYMSYWYVNDWASSLGYFLDDMEIEEGQYDWGINAAKNWADQFKRIGGTLSYKFTTDANGDKMLKPKSFSLTWPAATTTTSSGTATTTTGGGNIAEVTKKERAIFQKFIDTGCFVPGKRTEGVDKKLGWVYYDFTNTTNYFIMVSANDKDLGLFYCSNTSDCWNTDKLIKTLKCGDKEMTSDTYNASTVNTATNTTKTAVQPKNKVVSASPAIASAPAPGTSRYD